ncbi:MAG: rhodanese-like domain-containing protein [Bacteroidia bacterium]
MLFPRINICLVFAFFIFASCSAQNNNPVDISATDFEAKLKNQPGILVDVRTPKEFTIGHIAGAVNMNLFDDDFNERILKLDTAKTIYVYCAVGGRSSEAAELLLKSGYKKVYNLKRGITGWKEMNLPVEK